MQYEASVHQHGNEDGKALDDWILAHKHWNGNEDELEQAAYQLPEMVFLLIDGCKKTNKMCVG
jgi:hypothetical protein